MSRVTSARDKCHENCEGAKPIAETGERTVRRYAKLVDLSILILAGLLINFARYDLLSVLISLLAALSAASLCLFEEKRLLQAIVLVTFALAAALWPPLRAYLSLVAYFVLYHPRALLLSIALIPASFEILKITDLRTLVLHLFLPLVGLWLAKLNHENSAQAQALLLQKDHNREQAFRFQEQREAWLNLRDNDAKAATLEERARIAREMHDSVGHVLTRAILQTGALQKLNKDQALAGPLEALAESLDSGMSQTRASLHQLRDRSVDLYDEILRITEKPESAQFEVKLEYELTRTLPQVYQQTFIATAQEALTNVAKHSNATRVWLSLREFPAFFQLIVRDNGQGGGMGKTGQDLGATDGMGLRNMEERCKALGGSFYIRRDKGFGIYMTLPWPPRTGGNESKSIGRKNEWG